MPTVSRTLPARPHLDVPKRAARELLEDWRTKNPEAHERIQHRHPRFKKADTSTLETAEFRLNDAQLVIAREYGFTNWTELKDRINLNTVAGLLNQAIRADDRETVVRLLKENPQSLHLPVWSANWGPPMSHAANLGRLEIIKAIAALGAKDYQHAFDRALLQGKIECAQWFLDHGGKLLPGIIMGVCETLNAKGLRFLAELNAPFTNDRGDRLAPLALALETYSRFPKGKHEVLEIFAVRGYDLPDTPIMAFHRGDVAKLKQHFQRDPGLIGRRFEYREIYPPELGCANDSRSGLHGTPIGGTSLLHLAIDFDEQEIFDFLLANGADVNARATVDAEGFGGHTPLFNAVISQAYQCGRQQDAAITRTLIQRGASPRIRASLRKFLDWIEKPGWHQTLNATPAEWGRKFPDQNWVNQEALRLLEEK